MCDIYLAVCLMVVSDWSKTYIGMEHHSAKHCLFKLVGNVFGSDAVTSLGLWAGLGFIILFVIRKMTHFVHLSNESNLPGLNLILQEDFAISNGYCVYIVFLFSLPWGDREDSGGEAPLPDSSLADMEPRRKKRSQHHQVRNGQGRQGGQKMLFVC